MRQQGGSAGHVSQEAVKKYIQEQQGKDVFEYNVYGNPNQKIGDFTQTKFTVNIPIFKEVKSGCNANDGIPPNNELLGILPTIL